MLKPMSKHDARRTPVHGQRWAPHQEGTVVAASAFVSANACLPRLPPKRLENPGAGPAQIHTGGVGNSIDHCITRMM